MITKIIQWMNIPLSSTRTFKHQSTRDCNGGVRFSKITMKQKNLPTFKQAVGRETKALYLSAPASHLQLLTIQKLENESTNEIVEVVGSILEGALHRVKPPAGTYSIDLAPLQMWNPKMEGDH